MSPKLFYLILCLFDSAHFCQFFDQLEARTLYHRPIEDYLECFLDLWQVWRPVLDLVSYRYLFDFIIIVSFDGQLKVPAWCRRQLLALFVCLRVPLSFTFLILQLSPLNFYFLTDSGPIIFQILLIKTSSAHSVFSLPAIADLLTVFAKNLESLYFILWSNQVAPWVSCYLLADFQIFLDSK